MRKAILVLSFAFLFLSGALALTTRWIPSQDEEPVPIDDTFWQGTVTVEENVTDQRTPRSGMGTGTRVTESHRKTTFTLDRVPRTSDVDEWAHEEVSFEVSGTYHVLEIIPPDPEVNFKGSRTEMSDTVSGKGTAEVTLTPEGDDEGRPTRIHMSFRPNPDSQKVTIKRHWVVTTGDGTRTWDEDLEGGGGQASFVAPYDPDRGVLAGVTSDRRPYSNELEGNLKGVAETKYHYSLTLSRPTDLEAVITPLPDYDKWLPKADKTEDQAGPSPLAVKVRLRKKGGSNEPGPKKAKFEFELLETTKEKGVCLNWPADNPQDTYDLRIEADKNDELVFEKGDERDGQKAKTKSKNLSEATVTVSCFDWGAYARLKVTAVLDDGQNTRIPAHLESDKSTYELTIPMDKNGNHIADRWEDDRGVTGQPEDDDSETDPEGDGDPGDGLTLYEEYRGFLENGGHISGNPKKKDLFICNKIGPLAELGLSLFESISGLAVHAKLKPPKDGKPGELAADRVINRNRTKMPHIVKQHGLFIEKGDAGLTSEAEGEAGYENINGPPKTCKKIKIGLGLFTAGSSAYHRASTVAHEILHCCSVWHHGQVDMGRRKFKTKTDAAGVKRIFVYGVDDDGNAVGTGTPITLYVEPAGDIIDPDQEPLLTGLNLWVGRKQGEHSGDTACVMRYSAAHVYMNRASKYVLFRENEEVGLSICDDGQGTGVNEPGRKPEPRYGDAAEGRGKCKKQICVNDKNH